MNPVALQLGPISIRWYAICIVSGFDTSRLSFHERSARKKLIQMLSLISF